MGDRISIAEARARRADPVWRRRYKAADLTGIALVVLLLVVPLAAWVMSPPLGAALLLALLLVAPAAIAWIGPAVGLERRAALLVAIPGLNLLVLVPGVWRAAHLHIQHWQGPLQPAWDDSAWLAAGALGALAWLAAAAGLVLTLA